MSDDAPLVANEYRLKGFPLTPTGIKHLILELFTGQTVERHNIVKAVEKAHFERGGATSRAADFSRSVKKALRDLSDKGLADNPTYGFWRIKAGENSIESLVAPLQEDVEADVSLQAEISLGVGESCVYLYYYPAYRQNAEYNDKKVWACKIGRSDRDPISRIYSQSSTALPESPTIGLLLRTSLPSQWEHVLHKILAIRGCILDDAPGEEWFNTSPKDVLEIINFIEPSLMLESRGTGCEPGVQLTQASAPITT